jgi:hypothetical protein
LNIGRYELSRDDISQVFTGLYKEGVRFVFLQGGEPLLRRDLVPILQDLVQIGFHITLITNGTRLTSNLVEAFNKLAVSPSISLDTLDPIKYERIRGADQLDHVLAGLELLRGYQPHLSRRLLAASKGRALQMNAGAKQARGEWLLFLHADRVLPVVHSNGSRRWKPIRQFRPVASCTGSPEMIGGFDSFRSWIISAALAAESFLEIKPSLFGEHCSRNLAVFPTNQS